MKKIAVLTSGGDCSGLNAVIEAIVRGGIKEGYEIIGFERGYDGLLSNDYIKLDERSVMDLSRKGGSIIRNSNKTNLFNFRVKKDDGTYEYKDVSDIAVKNLREDDVECLVVVGGDGSMTSARDFMRKGVNVVCVPKTIDNDVPYTDRSFGYTTAYFHIADAVQSLKTTAYSHERVMVLEVMGRQAGWLALEGGIGGNADAILLPEINYEVEKIVAFLKERFEKGYRSSVIVVSEGAHERGKEQVAFIDKNYPDAVKLGGVGAILAKQIEEKLKPITGQEVRNTNLAYVQRGGDTNVNDIILGFRYGTLAIRAIKNKDYAKMVAVKGGEDTFVPITDIVGNGPVGETSTGGAHNVELDSPLLKCAKELGIYLGE